MGPLEGLAVSWGIDWAVGKIAGEGFDETGLEAQFKAFVESVPHLPKVLDEPIEAAATVVLGAVGKILKDQGDIKTMLKALAANNPPAAKLALKALLAPVLPAELGALVAAA